jgi:Asp-tRNA(Asn)/Glu-tRNA(Gln) amidotransferase A subunit family amidase
MTEPFRLTASQAQVRFQDGSLTVEEYVKSLLARIDARDTTINAWAYLNSQMVLERARELDQLPKEGRGLLHGVVVGVKDVILTKDMPTQYNSPIYEDDAPKIDAESVMLLRAKGALIFGTGVTCFLNRRETDAE